MSSRMKVPCLFPLFLASSWGLALGCSGRTILDSPGELEGQNVRTGSDSGGAATYFSADSGSDPGRDAGADDTGTCHTGQTSCNGMCLDSRAPGACIVALASGLNEVIAIAVNTTSVYWTAPMNDYGTAGPSVMRVSVDGGTPVMVASGGYPEQIALDDTSVYWTSWAGPMHEDEQPNPQWLLMKAPLNGGSVATLWSGASSLGGIAVNATDVYCASGGDEGSILKVATNGGAPTTITTGQDGTGGIAAEGTSIYWGGSYINGEGQTTGGSVMKAAVAGGVTTTLTTAQDAPQNIVADAKNVYWTTYDGGTVMQVPVGGGAPTTIASGQDGPDNLAVDGTSVYWTNLGAYPFSNATVMKAPIGGGELTTIASGQSGPCSIAVDETSVYWSTADVTGANPSTVMKATPK
jgi:hypothetical protein